MSQMNLMRTDIRETDDKYIFDIEIPGCKKENVQIYVKNSDLYVKVKKEKELAGKVLKRESFIGEYSRSYDLGDIKKIDNFLSAKVEDGMLTISIDKAAYQDDEAIITIE